jgi:hypothetical protein
MFRRKGLSQVDRDRATTHDEKKGDYSYSNGSVVSHLGLTFRWTEDHMNPEEIQPSRMIGDPLADAALEEALEAHASAGGVPSKDFLGMIVEHAFPAGSSKAPNACLRFLQDVAHGPDFAVDKELVEIGQNAFLYRIVSAPLALLHLSLVGGFSAPSINKVLNSTGYITNDNPKMVMARLLETFTMVLSCMTDGAETFAGRITDDNEFNAGEGLLAALKVRLLHAFVRRSILKKTGTRKWDSAAHGVPINQADLATTGLSFSINVIYGCESLYDSFTPKEREAYVHLWKVVCFYMGVQYKYNPHVNYEVAQAKLDSYAIHCIKPDDSSVAASHNVLRGVAGQPPTFLRFDQLSAISRLMMGDTLADKLALPKKKFSGNAVICFVIAMVHIGHFFGFVMAWMPFCGGNRRDRIGKLALKRIRKIILWEKGEQFTGMDGREKAGMGMIKSVDKKYHA